MLHERIKLRNNDDVYLETYIIDDPLERNRKRPLVVVCPGGGYEGCSEREAEPIALAFNSAGFHAVVVYYSLKQLFPEALKDLSDSVCVVRDNAEKWRVDTDKVIVCGFSAGGHLCASTILYDDVYSNLYHADEIDTYSSLPKQFLLQKAILAYYKMAEEALENGANADDLIALPVRERIGRLKYSKESDTEAEYNAIITQLQSEINAACERGEE